MTTKFKRKLINYTLLSTPPLTILLSQTAIKVPSILKTASTLKCRNTLDFGFALLTHI